MLNQEQYQRYLDMLDDDALDREYKHVTQDRPTLDQVDPWMSDLVEREYLNRAYTDDDDMRVHAPRDDQMDTYANQDE